MAAHDTPVMLFGFQQYTAVWSGHARATTDLTDWVHVPAKNLVTLADTLTQFPKLEVLVVDVFNDLLKDLNPLDLPSSLSETLGGFYNGLERSFDVYPKLKVSWSHKAGLLPRAPVCSAERFKLSILQSISSKIHGCIYQVSRILIPVYTCS